MIYSIDQNCSSLWDTVPKLQALARAGRSVRHFIEDVDVAFTAVGAGLDGRLTLKRERYYYSGGADWGTAMFYSEFLGRLPSDVRRWEPLTGLRTAALAKKLGRTPESLYDEFSPGDNWQLVGPSYVGDRRHHRVIADLTVAETAPFLRQLLRTAQADMLARFVSPDASERLWNWFAREENLIEEFLSRHRNGRLTDLYRSWLERYVRYPVSLDLMSSLLADAASPLLEFFMGQYELAVKLYNQALRDTGSPLRPLDASRGELPFFGVFEYQGHLVRAEAALQNDALVIADKVVPFSAGRRISPEILRRAGIRCLAGKAIILAIDVRLGERGAALAMPYRGSLYMHTAKRLAELLVDSGLPTGPLQPVVRVRFRLLERMRSLTTTIALPEHLAEAFGCDQIAAGEFARRYRDVAAEASARLESLANPVALADWQRRNLPDLAEQLDRLDARRRALAETAPKSEEIRLLWKQAKDIHKKLLDATVHQLDRDRQVADLDYWDSRGAIMPWCIALGGESFYNEVLARAEIYEEP